MARLRDDPQADKRALYRYFGLKGGERIALKEILAALTAEGLFPPAPSDTGDRQGSTDVLLVRITGIDLETGEALATPVEWLRAGGVPRLRLNRFDTAGLEIGARALVRIGERRGLLWRARVLRRAPDLPDRIVGVVRRTAIGRILDSVDKRQRQEFVLTGEGSADVSDGELVVAAPLAPRRFERPSAQLLERLGSADAPRAASAIAVALHEIPVAFAPATLEEVRRITPATAAGRVDLRHLPLVTIDGADARDFDDAVFAEPDPENAEGWRLVVAIADVAWYVRPGSALDGDAQRRGNSVYFPDRVVPMLPERLSNDLCSLRPDEDRPVLVAELRIDRDGQLRSHRFLRAMMRSAARLTYERLQTWADGERAAIPTALQGPAQALYQAYRLLAAARLARGTLDLDVAEREVKLDATGTVTSIAPRARLDAHRLIEEFMILANVAAAETLEQRRRGCLYRVHDQPSPERLDGLREALGTLGYRLAKGQVVRPSLLAAVLQWAAGKPSQTLVNNLVLRSQALAVYSPDNLGHFGLALPRYAHFTSPIRRYADLVVHRALIDALGLGAGGSAPSHEALVVLGETVSRAERRAQAAERAAMDRYVAGFLRDEVGARFTARISGLHRAGVFVSLLDSGAEGLVPMSSLPGRGWTLHPAGHQLDGPQRLALGDRIVVRLMEVAPITGALRFELDGLAATTKQPKAVATRSRSRQSRGVPRRRR